MFGFYAHLGECSNIVAELKALLYGLLLGKDWSFSLSHILREENACTNELSKLGLGAYYGLTILRDNPSYMISLVDRDMRSVAVPRGF